MLDQSPRFDLAGAEQLAREHYGARGRATALTSERDQNFLITGDGGSRMVLKVANAAEDLGIIEAQQRALTHLAQRLDITPRVLSTTNGRALAEATGPDGKRHLVWAISWLDGVPLATAKRKSESLDQNLGRQVGALRRELADFENPAFHRDFYWDLSKAREIVEEKRSLVHDAGMRRAIDRAITEIDRCTVPLLDRLPRAIVHGDLNDYNVLIGGGDDLWSRGQSVVGIVDFGDMVHSYGIGEMAIAIAYAILDRSDPLAVATSVVRGYARENAVSDVELSALYGLVLLRLCASACIAADQQAQAPDNEYLSVSQQAIRRALPELVKIPFALAETAFRAAAGKDPSPAATRVRDFLRSRKLVAPVLGIDLTSERSIVLDLSVSSPLLSGDRRENDEPRLTPRAFDEMARAQVRVSIGRYDEPRLLYVAPAFATGNGVTDEHRTIHIGLDLFAEAGTPVYAPIRGTIHAFADNASPQDYGPVIILKHETDDGTEFFTLYGHLSRESLATASSGRVVEAGEPFAALGAADVNGGWTPHLHLQIITDLLDLGTDFPGVARPSQRGAWVALCPDPNLLVRVPAERFPRNHRPSFRRSRHATRASDTT